MDIACPNCSAVYRVPDSLVHARKPVRCAACGTRWAPDLPRGEEGFPPTAAQSRVAAAAPAGEVLDTQEVAGREAPQDAPPEEAPLGDRSWPAAIAEDAMAMAAAGAGPAIPPPLAPTRWSGGSARRHKGGALLFLAWGASLLAAVAILGALLLHRDRIAAAWPPFGWVGVLLGG